MFAHGWRSHATAFATQAWATNGYEVVAAVVATAAMMMMLSMDTYTAVYTTI